MIFYYKAVGYKSGKTLVTGRYSDCVRHINKKARSRKEAAHDEPIKILLMDDELEIGLTPYERALKESFEKDTESETTSRENRSHKGMKRNCWTDEEDELVKTCKTYNDAELIGSAIGRSRAATWARLRRLKKKVGD